MTDGQKQLPCRGSPLLTARPCWESERSGALPGLAGEGESTPEGLGFAFLRDPLSVMSAVASGN